MSAPPTPYMLCSPTAGLHTCYALRNRKGLFDETLTLVTGLWLAVIIGGVIWLKLADSPVLGKPSATA